MGIYATDPILPDIGSDIEDEIKEFAGRTWAPTKSCEPRAKGQVMTLDWQRDPTFWDRFSDEGVLGSGEFGKVLQVQDKDGRLFALKVLYADAAPEAMTEILVLMNLDQVCDWFLKYYGAYIISDPDTNKEVYALLIEYMNQHDAGPEHHYWSSDDVIAIGKQVLCQMICMTAAGFLHRDIKPSNILIDQDKNTGRFRAVLADYGVACSFFGERGQIELCDRPAGDQIYLAPELLTQALAHMSNPSFANGQPSKKSEVWTLGLTLWLLLHPDDSFRLSNADQQLENVTSASLQRILDYDDVLLRKIETESSTDLEEVLEQMLRRDPTERISAQEALQKLVALN